MPVNEKKYNKEEKELVSMLFSSYHILLVVQMAKIKGTSHG